MQAQFHDDAVRQASVENDVAQNQPNKAKGALSKVKQKASKIKDKVKRVATAGSNSQKSSLAEGQKKRALLNSALAQDKPLFDHNSSSEQSNSGDDEERETQLKYDQLNADGTADEIQGDGSDVEHHGGVPVPSAALGGTFWDRDGGTSPSISSENDGLQKPLHSSPSEYQNPKATSNDEVDQGGPSGKPKVGMFSVGDSQPVATITPRDQVGRFSEDLAADQKLGLGQDEVDKGEQRTTASDGNNACSTQGKVDGNNIIPSTLGMKETLIDGADEQIYKPVQESDNFDPSLTSGSMNERLYGDVLANQDKHTFKENKNVNSSSRNEREFSFDTENGGKKDSYMGGLPVDNESTASTAGMSATSDTVGQEHTGRNRSVDGKDHLEEGWGNWSSDKVNQTVDKVNQTVEGLALKLGEADTSGGKRMGMPERKIRNLSKTMSGDYYDPTNTETSSFNQELTLGGEDADEENPLVSTALASTVAIAETIHKLKESVASTLGYGNVVPSDEDHNNGQSIDTNQPAALQETRKDKDMKGQDVSEEARKTDLFSASKIDSGIDKANVRKPAEVDASLKDMTGQEGLSEDVSKTYLSSASKIDSGIDKANVHKPAEVDASLKDDTGISHQWSLDSASDVPQAAFL